jgi:hypothetical protein
MYSGIRGTAGLLYRIQYSEYEIMNKPVDKLSYEEEVHIL